MGTNLRKSRTQKPPGRGEETLRSGSCEQLNGTTADTEETFRAGSVNPFSVAWAQELLKFIFFFAVDG